MNEIRCPTGKRGFTSRAQATDAIRAIRSGDRLRPYFCRQCHDWHMTKHADRRGALSRKRTAGRGRRA